jgi:hypothetical protein
MNELVGEDWEENRGRREEEEQRRRREEEEEEYSINKYNI